MLRVGACKSWRVGDEVCKLVVESKYCAICTSAELLLLSPDEPCEFPTPLLCVMIRNECRCRAFASLLLVVRTALELIVHLSAARLGSHLEASS